MPIVAISRVRNEADIIEAFVRHTTAHVDRHLILDNQSTDSTPEILHALRTEGLPIEVETDDSIGIGRIPSRGMTRLLRDAVGVAGPDGWVVPVDADEFISPESRLGEILRGVESPVLAPWRTYVPSVDDDAAVLNPVERIRHRLVAEAWPWSKVLVPARIAARATLRPGSHRIDLDGEPVPARRDIEGLRLAHFPVRSAEQYAVKVIIGNLGHALDPEERGTMGFHYMEPYEQLKTDWPALQEGYREAAANFAVRPDDGFEPEIVEDPMRYAGGALMHTPDRRGSEPLRSVLEFTEVLAIRLAEMNGLGEAGSA